MEVERCGCKCFGSNLLTISQICTAAEKPIFPAWRFLEVDQYDRAEYMQLEIGISVLALSACMSTRLEQA
eukprot:2485502-Pleurochrysis_carterae.AAC.3